MLSEQIFFVVKDLPVLLFLSVGLPYFLLDSFLPDFMRVPIVWYADFLVNFSGIVTTEIFFLLLVLVTITSTLRLLVILVRALFKKKLIEKKQAAILFLVVLFCSITSSAVLLADEFFSPVSMQYFSINAALKNTCVNWNKCPNTVEELKGLDQSFYPLLENKKVVFKKDDRQRYFYFLVKHDQYVGTIFTNEGTVNGIDWLDIQFNGSCKITTQQKYFDKDVLCK